MHERTNAPHCRGLIASSWLPCSTARSKGQSLLGGRCQGGTFTALASQSNRTAGASSAWLRGARGTLQHRLHPEYQKHCGLRDDLEQRFQRLTTAGSTTHRVGAAVCRDIDDHKSEIRSLRKKLAEVRRRSEDILPRLSPVNVAPGTLGSIQQAVDAIAERWANAPEYIVARNMQDRAPSGRCSRIGSVDWAPPAYFMGSSGTGIAIIGSHSQRTQGRRKVMFHEALGHYEPRGVFGESLVPIGRSMAF